MVSAWTIVLGVVLAALVVVLTAVLATAARRARRSRRRVEEQLAGSRSEVAELAAQVTRLAAEVEAGRRRTAEDHGYVITTLSEAAQVSGRVPAPGLGPSGTPLAEVVEQQAVSRLARVDTSTRVGTRLAELGVKALALAHGVRRATTQENLDRAAAEAHVARRRSRRTRRQELREARRLLRTVRAQQPMREQGSQGAA
jgi:hypothetical protein